MTHQDVVIHWFRQDLRLRDNPALVAAAHQGVVVPVYILDDINAGEFAVGEASRWWLHHSLMNLNKSLDGQLHVFVGDPLKIIPALVSQFKAKALFWNRCYEPWRVERDRKIKEDLSQSIHVESHNGSLLWEPWQVLKSDGTPYRVFTPFYKKGCLKAQAPSEPLNRPRHLSLVQAKPEHSIDSLNLKPEHDWAESLAQHWEIGEEGAKKTLDRFLRSKLKDYKKGRDYPSLNSVSRLSPHLHWGEISPHQVWHAACRHPRDENLEHFLSELAWREFSYSLLFYNPTLPTDNLQDKFDRFPWKKDAKALKAWQQGLTGIPIVDAGMRELWKTGYMHNRIRMVVASFLVKNCLLHWREGEAWFWDTLVDADLANNSASWQWVAGCGADAAPFFRIFNPVTQGQKFDPKGEYTRNYVPELKRMPDKYLFNPWEAPSEVLSQAGVVLGQNYPKPIVDLKASRERALEAFSMIRDTHL